MTDPLTFPMTAQGVRDLNRPVPAAGPCRAVNVGPNERTVSTVGGAVLAGIGLANGGLTGLLVAAAGAALAYRGVSGHCAAYAAAGIDTTK